MQGVITGLKIAVILKEPPPNEEFLFTEKIISQIKIVYVIEGFQCISYPNKEFVFADEEGYFKDDRKFCAFFVPLPTAFRQ